MVQRGDIGVAVSSKEVDTYVSSGKDVLFNTACGLFDLKWLTENLEYIINELPTRISVQNKDRGHYSQAEQITWEVISMIPEKLIFAVNKYQRFIAAKMVTEMLMASELDDIDIHNSEYPEQLTGIAENLQQGLKSLLSGPYGLKMENHHWVPLSLKELEERFRK